MKKSVLLFVSLMYMMAYGQKKSILIYDLVNGTLDSITNINYDTTVLSENTVYNLGCFNSSIETLSNTPPTSNVYPGSQFTYKKKVSSDFDLTNFPIRTSVKIFQTNNNTLEQLCSGSLISRKHVLTAAHCISNINSNLLRSFDSLYVSPIFDNGNFNTNFNSSYVSKVYFFRDWKIGGEDFAVLELAEPIGESTGWISIGFNTVDTLLTEGIFYKFSYPAFTSWIDTNHYNGDTLYYNYGVIDRVNDNMIGINNASGITGESGSSIIKVENEQNYISYGVLSLASNLNHSRINNWRYYAIKSIIKDDLIIDDYSIDNIILYPNPANSVVHIKNIKRAKVLELILYDNMGRRCLIQNEFKSCLDFNISNLSAGIYYLSIVTPESIITKKIIKNRY
jgi:V8-like Glu-specific endopeptidase